MDVDPAVELVDVNGVDALFQPVDLCLKPSDRCVMLRHLIVVALTQGVRHCGENFIAKPKLIEDLTERFSQHFLAHIGLTALPLEAGAAVVDVAPLLDVAYERAAAMSALYEAGKGEVVLRPLPAAAIALGEDRLNPLPYLHADDRLVPAPEGRAVPFEVACVDAVTEDRVDVAHRYRTTGSPVNQADLLRFAACILQRDGSASISLKKTRDQRSDPWINLDDPPPVRPSHVAIAQGGL